MTSRIESRSHVHRNRKVRKAAERLSSGLPFLRWHWNAKFNEIISHFSQEHIIHALKKKKECNVRAQDIVEELLDPVSVDKIPAFLEKVRRFHLFQPIFVWNLQRISIRKQLAHINQSHFDDIVEERAIMKLCGYPLCDIELEDVPTKQYQISAKQNKVFDITVRKNFCSNKCFKSAEYLKEQLLTTPLWVRKDDDKLPEFKLLPLDHKDEE